MSDERDDLKPGDELPPEEPAAGELPCDNCGGSGEYDGTPCPVCDGTGRIAGAVGGG